MQTPFMNNKYKYLLKNTGILTISNFSSKILVFFLVPLYTSILSTAEYGIYDLVVTTAQLLYPIVTLNIVDGVMRFSMDKEYNPSDIVSVALRIIVIGFALIGAVLLGNIVLSVSGILAELSGVAFLYYVSYVLNQLMIQFAKGMERIKELGISGILGTAATIAANILCLIVFKLGLMGFFVANIIGLIMPALYLIFAMKAWKYLSLSKNNALRKEMLVYSVPLILTTVGWWFNSSADKYVVIVFCGAAANGLLSIAYKIPTILNTVQSIFIQAWQVSAIKEYGKENSTEFYGRMFVIMSSIMCIGCSIIMCFTQLFARFLFSNDFFYAWRYVPFLLISSVFNCSAGFFGPILTAIKDTKSMAKSALYGTIVNVILNIVLIYIVGIQGATIATLVSSYVTYIVRKRAAGDIVDGKQYLRIVASWIILLFEAVCQIWVQKFVYIISACCIVGMFGLYRKTILLFIVKIRNILKSVNKGIRS